MTRTLIVNADDLGLSEGVNRGILRAHDDGIVTSASLMVREPAAQHAAERIRTRPRLSVGLHVDLDAWLDAPGGAIRDQVAGQLERFRALLGRDPDHLDSHHHVHHREPNRAAVLAMGDALRVPVRGLDPVVRYCGSFYGRTPSGDPRPEAITVSALLGILRGLPEGVTELGCHPGLDPGLASSYRDERLLEVDVLCDERVRAALARERIELRSFAR